MVGMRFWSTGFPGAFLCCQCGSNETVCCAPVFMAFCCLSRFLQRARQKVVADDNNLGLKSRCTIGFGCSIVINGIITAVCATGCVFMSLGERV